MNEEDKREILKEFQNFINDCWTYEFIEDNMIDDFINMLKIRKQINS